MPTKKKTFDPLDKPEQEPQAPVRPQAKIVKPTMNGHVMAEVIKFGGLFLARLENEEMYISTNGYEWRQFVFEIV